MYTIHSYYFIACLGMFTLFVFTFSWHIQGVFLSIVLNPLLVYNTVCFSALPGLSEAISLDDKAQTIPWSLRTGLQRELNLSPHITFLSLLQLNNGKALPKEEANEAVASRGR